MRWPTSHHLTLVLSVFIWVWVLVGPPPQPFLFFGGGVSCSLFLSSCSFWVSCFCCSERQKKTAIFCSSTGFGVFFVAKPLSSIFFFVFFFFFSFSFFLLFFCFFFLFFSVLSVFRFLSSPSSFSCFPSCSFSIFLSSFVSCFLVSSFELNYFQIPSSNLPLFQSFLVFLFFLIVLYLLCFLFLLFLKKKTVLSKLGVATNRFFREPLFSKQ